MPLNSPALKSPAITPARIDVNVCILSIVLAFSPTNRRFISPTSISYNPTFLCQ